MENQGLIVQIAQYIFFPIFIGVISTAIYVLIFDNLLQKIVIPWYFSRKYKSTLIDGKWTGKTEIFDFEFNIFQAGDRVSGEIIAKTFYPPKEKNKSPKIVDSNTYCFDGEIKDGFVRIIHKEKDRNSFGFGCFLFQIAGGGKTLNGSVIFVDEDDSAYSVQTQENIQLRRE